MTPESALARLKQAIAQDFRVNDVQGITDFLREVEQEAVLVGLPRRAVERALGPPQEPWPHVTLAAGATFWCIGKRVEGLPASPPALVLRFKKARVADVRVSYPR